MGDQWPTPEWKLDIPDEPVDGFTVEWWTIDAHYGIKHRSAKYFVDTPYEVEFPDKADRGGAPIVDQWMIYERGYCTGRTNEGWDKINFQAHEARFSKRFKTYDEAVAAYLDMLDAQEKRAEQELESIRTRRKFLPLEFDPEYSEHDLR